MSVIVSDTSPVRSLAHLGHLSWLEDLFGNVLLPPAVANELIHPPLGLHVVEVYRVPFLAVRSAENSERISELCSTLDIGEAEAIALAEEVKADLILIDEAAGRAVARECGFPVLGTLGILLQAKRQGLCPEVRPQLDRLQTEFNFFVSPRLRQQILRQAGE